MDQQNSWLVEICGRLKRNDPTLTELDLGGNEIDSKGAESIAEALKSNTTLIQLNLGVNQIDSKGAESLAEALKSNTTLTQLNLWRNLIDSKVAKQIDEMIERNRKLLEQKKSQPVFPLPAQPKMVPLPAQPKMIGLTIPTHHSGSNQPGANFEIDISELKLGDELGRGGFGVVKRAIYKGKQVAVKFVEGAASDQKFYECFRKELEILSTLEHPSIVKCLGGCTVAPNLCIVTEYCNGGSLYNLLHIQKLEFSSQQQLDFALKIAEGMEYLHTHKPMVIHRELKSANILLQDGVPKIIDFGVSQTKEFSTLFSTANVGTYNWMAPELMEPGQNHNEKVDVWSYAMVLYEITTNRIPYNHCQNQVQIIREVCDKKQKPTFPKDREIDPTLRDLMNRCWNWEPQNRPSFTEIVQTLRNAIKQSKPTTKK